MWWQKCIIPGQRCIVPNRGLRSTKVSFKRLTEYIILYYCPTLSLEFIVSRCIMWELIISYGWIIDCKHTTYTECGIWSFILGSKDLILYLTWICYSIGISRGASEQPSHYPGWWSCLTCPMDELVATHSWNCKNDHNTELKWINVINLPPETQQAVLHGVEYTMAACLCWDCMMGKSLSCMF